MKKEYEIPAIEYLTLEAEDAITASPTTYGDEDINAGAIFD